MNLKIPIAAMTCLIWQLSWSARLISGLPAATQLSFDDGDVALSAQESWSEPGGSGGLSITLAGKIAGGWKVVFSITSGFSIQNLWNGIVDACPGNVCTISNTASNGDVLTSQPISIGMNMRGNPGSSPLCLFASNSASVQANGGIFTVNIDGASCKSPAPTSTTAGGLPTTTMKTTQVPPKPTTSNPAPPIPSSIPNPYVGALPYTNRNFKTNIDISIALAPEITCQANELKKYGVSTWIDTMDNIALIAPTLEDAAKIAKGQPIVVQFVIYDLPGRDCAALASNGEIPATADGLNTYKTQYIDAIVSEFSKKASNIRLVLIIEPDSLPNLLTNLDKPGCALAGPFYQDGVAYALSRLASVPNTYQYLDIAHGGWLGWPANTNGIVNIMKPVISKAISLGSSLNPPVDVASTIVGFATNTANYSPTHSNGLPPARQGGGLVEQNGQLFYQGNPAIDETLYVSGLVKAFEGTGLPTRFLIDTSRNGVPDIRNQWGSWCNVKGAGIGYRPQVNPGPNIDAYIWVKPPGESDGVSGPSGAPRLDAHCDPTTYEGQDSLANAPQAGQWFHDQFVMLIQNAVPSLPFNC